MTRAIKLLAVLLVPTVLVWLSAGFVLWNWNPKTWAEGSRFIFVGFSFVLTIPAVAAFIAFGENT